MIDLRRFKRSIFAALAALLVVAVALGTALTRPARAETASPAPAEWSSYVKAFWEADCADTEKRLGGGRVKPGENKRVLDEQALILTTDKDPLDVQLRRTKALIARLKTLKGAPDLKAIEAKVAEIDSQAADARQKGPEAVKALYMQLRAVTRQAAFSNPLLNLSDIAFQGYVAPGGDFHMVDQYVGWNAREGGGLYIIKNFKTAPMLVNILEKSTVADGRFKGQSLIGGAFNTPELSYDAKRIAFAWTTQADKCYHIFTVNIDGTNLRQLTDGQTNRAQLGCNNTSSNDFDPCWLPDGRIAFISDRRGGYGRCHLRPLMTYTLYSMKQDGSDIIPLSYHETNEWDPSVDHDGKIVYSRWDYIDRDDCIAHHLWTCYPDGRDPRSPHGNYPFPRSYEESESRSDGRGARPNGEWNIRAIPGSHRYIATASGHHCPSYGQLVMIDTRVPDDGRASQVTGITTGQDWWPDSYGDYGTAWPLSEDFYLCNYKEDIILLDRYGNKELICPKSIVPGPLAKIVRPMPLVARPVPPVIPPETFEGERASADAPKATVSVMNVYEGDMPMPEGTKIKWLRVIQILPQLTPYMNQPKMGYGSESLSRMPLGIVPVEKDGSAYFKAPVGKTLYFQLLNEQGLAVRSMRSVTYVHAGERLTCLGCHEKRENSPPANWTQPVAMKRAPSDLKPEVPSGAIPFNWHILAKPVLQQKCASCHAERGKGPDMSYASLKQYVFYYPFQNDGYVNGEITRSGSRTVPGKFGAMASPLLKYMDKSHYGVTLTPDEFRRITLWIDCNSNELGAYIDVDKARNGEVVWPQVDVDPKNPTGVER